MSANATPAATILLLRDEPSFEVLMVERHKDMNFAGGALVFPGGRIDKGDSDPAWADHVSGFASIPIAERTARIAALREAFEETGILMAQRAGCDAFLNHEEVSALNPWRSKIEADDHLFLALVREERLILACDQLQLFAHWVPPEFANHRRYDTLFFAARSPSNQQAREDGNEATKAMWANPGAALASCEAGECQMIFPTVRNVELLNVSNSVEDVLRFASERRIEKVQPALVMRDGKPYVTIPDNLGYPITEIDATQVARS